MTGPVRVVVVEDSTVQRAHLVAILEATRTIKVVGQVSDGQDVVKVVRAAHPDVVTMDLHIPGGGVNAIRELMEAVPVPVLVLSVAAGAEGRSPAALEALAAGALEVLPKPSQWRRDDENRLRRSVAALKGARPAVGICPGWKRPPGTARPVIAIVASTGGPGAIARVLRDLRGIAAPVLVVQHLHRDFLPGFVTWLGTVCELPVVAASDGTMACCGTVYVAPPDTHLRLDALRRLHLDPSPVSIHRPSGDELLRSVASAAGPAGIGVLLTGMGEDGAAGLLALRQAGGMTICQDEATSAVFGMPAAAHRMGASAAVLSIDEIGRAVARAVKAQQG